MDVKTFGWNDLNEVIKSLYLDEPFFGYVLNKLSRRVTTGIPTAAISGEEMELLVNPEFMSGFDLVGQKCVLKHEVLHAALGHWERFKLLGDSRVHVAANVAADAAINQLIPGFDKLKGGFISLDTIRRLPGCEGAKEKETMEYYYGLLMSLRDLLQGGGERDGEGDESQGGRGGKPLDKDIKEGHEFSEGNSAKKNGPSGKTLKRVFKEAKEAQKRYEKKMGTEPGKGLSSVLPSYDDPVEKSIWEKLIDRTLGEDRVAEKEFRFGQPSRRMEGSFWKSVHELRSQKVYIGVDTSASIENRELTKFMGYISKGLKMTGAEATLIFCDTEIAEVKKVRSLPKNKEISVPGRGGTNLTKILDYIEDIEKKKDLSRVRLILLTDGETPWRESKIKTSVVYTASGTEISPIYNSAFLK